MNHGSKRQWSRREGEPRDLESKVRQSGNLVSLGLESNASAAEPNDRSSSWSQKDTHGANTSIQQGGGEEEEVEAGIYGGHNRNYDANSTVASLQRQRLFRTPSTATAGRSHASTTGNSSTVASKSSRFSRASTTFSRATNTARAAHHIVCAISENMAQETCVASLDAGLPHELIFNKQGNAHTYAETIHYLQCLKPNEVLLNEGRQSSQLTRKILEFYQQESEVGLNHSFVVPTKKSSQAQSRRGARPFASSHRKKNSKQDQEEDEAASGIPATEAVVKFISRACFDQTKGAELLRRIAREETYDQSVVGEYILLSSAHAVLNYATHSLGVSIAPKCLFLSNGGGNNRMVIDRSTMLQLELLVNSKTGKVKNSLIGTIDKTKTSMGSHLLRKNLMQPPTDVETIRARLDLVDLLLENQELFFDVHEHLSHLPNLDKILLTSTALVPRNRPTKLNSNKSSDMRIASKGISALLGIKAILTAMPAFSKALRRQIGQEESEIPDEASVPTHRNSLMVGIGRGDGQSSSSISPLQPNDLLRAIIFSMSNPDLKHVLKAVSDAFVADTKYSRDPNTMRHQECFALKEEEGGVMNILRKAFRANVDDIYAKADEYAEHHGFTATVKYTSSRGFFLAIPSDQARELPDTFIQASISGRYIHCTTEEISSLNSRSRENMNDLLLLTYDRTQEILDSVRSYYDALASLCDAVALLDMCHAFADTVSLSSRPWCRPDVLDRTMREATETATSGGSTNPGSSLMIRNGRFAIDVTSAASSEAPDSFTPNDTFTGNGIHFTTITGINGSGKSTYLKQLALIVVLAHCGSYVPADMAVIPVRDRLAARIGTTDDQENNISTFMMEMKETATICNNATETSLILIDELGRATSNEDGVSIAWAVAEYLVKKRAMTFFVTHYPQLSRLADIYPSVQNVHLDATISAGEIGEISYTHKIKSGACQMESDYGVKLAALCGWPPSVVAEASKIEREVQAILPKDGPCEGNSSSSATATSSGKLAAFHALQGIRQVLKSNQDLEQPHTIDSFRNLVENLKQVHFGSQDDSTLAHFQQLLIGGGVSKSNKDDTLDGEDSSLSSSSSSSSSGDSDDTSSLSSEDT